MPNNPNAVDNLKPFVKGDPRINRKGRPKSFKALRELAQEVAHEKAKSGGNTLVIDGHSVTVAEAIIRQWAGSKNPQLQRAFIEIAYGKTPEAVAADEAEESNTAERVPTRIGAEQIAGTFADAYRDILRHGHSEYVFHGGRGSTKSTFVSLATIMLVENNPQLHALAVRKVGTTLRDSVFSQLKWAIAELGHEEQWKYTVSPLEMTFIPTGQKIYFRGADDPLKIKSIKPEFGAIGILWFEELDQFAGANEIRNIEQSAIRGTDSAYIFKSFNPPQSKSNWANKYVEMPKPGRFTHRSDYRQVPPEWLGQVFISEAEFLREINPSAYEHEYLGVPNSAGGLVFPNVTLRDITDDEIAGFEYIYHGLDWGYAVDPAHWGKMAYDNRTRTLVIFDEFRATGMSNRELYEALTEQKGVTPSDYIIADNAEPKSIADMASYGLTIRATEKGADSVPL